MDNTTAKLSDNHRRSLSVTAKTVEETIDQLEALLHARPSAKLMRKISRTYTPEERARLLAVLKQLRDANEGMINDLELRTELFDESQIAGAAFTRLWLVLADSVSDKMKGFGKIKSEAAHRIDKHIKLMLKILEQAQINKK
jgi:type VI protein secretion system component VasK